MFENPRRGRQARNFTTNVPKILDLKSSSEQIFFRELSLGAPVDWPLTKATVGYPSRTTVLYVQLRTWCTLIGAIFYRRLLKKNFAVEIIPKEQACLKRNKVENVSGSGLAFKDLQTVGTADQEMKGLSPSLHNHLLHLRWSPSALILSRMVKYFEENIQCLV